MAAFMDWSKGLLDSIRNDPNLKQALFQTGPGFIRTPQPGQSGWDVASEALMGGAGTLHALREKERQLKAAAEATAFQRAALAREEGREEKKLGMEGTRLEAYTGELGSQQAERAARSGREEKALPSELALRGAQSEQARAGAAENYAQAALAGRTDPNLRGTGGGGLGGTSAGGYDVRAAAARKAQLVAAGVDPIAAEAQAFREQDMIKQQTSPREAVQKRFQSKLDSVYGIADDKMRKQFLDESVQEVMAEQKLFEGASAAGRTVTDSRAYPAPVASPDSAAVRSPACFPVRDASAAQRCAWRDEALGDAGTSSTGPGSVDWKDHPDPDARRPACPGEGHQGGQRDGDYRPSRRHYEDTACQPVESVSADLFWKIFEDAPPEPTAQPAAQQPMYLEDLQDAPQEPSGTATLTGQETTIPPEGDKGFFDQALESSYGFLRSAGEEAWAQTQQLSSGVASIIREPAKGFRLARPLTEAGLKTWEDYFGEPAPLPLRALGNRVSVYGDALADVGQKLTDWGVLYEAPPPTSMGQAVASAVGQSASSAAMGIYGAARGVAPGQPRR